MADKTQTTIRLDSDLKEWLVLIADDNDRSLNGEIVRILKKEVERFMADKPEKQLKLFKKQ